MYICIYIRINNKRILRQRRGNVVINKQYYISVDLTESTGRHMKKCCSVHKASLKMYVAHIQKFVSYIFNILFLNIFYMSAEMNKM